GKLLQSLNLCELRGLRHELGAVRRLGRVLVSQLSHQELEERLLVECLLAGGRGRRRRRGAAEDRGDRGELNGHCGLLSDAPVNCNRSVPSRTSATRLTGPRSAGCMWTVSRWVPSASCRSGRMRTASCAAGEVVGAEPVGAVAATSAGSPAAVAAAVPAVAR